MRVAAKSARARSVGASLLVRLVVIAFRRCQQQCSVKRINNAGERSSTEAAIKEVALKSLGIEVRHASPAKQESRLASWASDFPKSGRILLCFSFHIDRNL